MQVVTAVLAIAIFGLASIPFVANNIDEIDATPTPTATASASPTPTETPTDTPQPNGTTLPSDGVFETRNGNSYIRISNKNGSTNVRVETQGDSEASVNVQSHIESSQNVESKNETTFTYEAN